jgi:hypothetical protein
MRMCHVAIFPALQYFSKLSHKWDDFRKIVIVCEMCALIFSTISLLILRRIERHMIKKVYWSPHKVPVIFVTL